MRKGKSYQVLKDARFEKKCVTLKRTNNVETIKLADKNTHTNKHQQFQILIVQKNKQKTRTKHRPTATHFYVT